MENKANELSERFLDFGVIIIKLCNKLNKTIVEREISKQLFRAGTSIGANYEEALGAFTRKEFKCKLGICLKEARETYYWL